MAHDTGTVGQGMGQLLLASLCCVAAPAFAAPSCPLEGMGGQAADSPACQFYLGTTAYRANDFQRAAQHWNSLLARKDLPLDERHWQIDARNNLGFLHFAGKGMAVSRDNAIRLWTAAFDAGHPEAAYHLCHTYADPKSGSFDLALGRQYCRQALRREEKRRRQSRRAPDPYLPQEVTLARPDGRYLGRDRLPGEQPGRANRMHMANTVKWTPIDVSVKIAG